MTFFRPVFASAVLASLLSSVACGGQTLGAAAGASERDDAGSTGTVDARPSSPPVVDAEVSPSADASLGDAGTVTYCSSNADCAAGWNCLWSVSEDFCTAFNPLGTCLPTGPLCNMVAMQAVGCGCGEQTVTWTFGCNGIPEGYAPEGIAHTGACADAASPDAGMSPPPDASAPTPCGSDAQCPSGEQCGYAIGDCDAPEVCLPSSWFSEPCNSEVPLCGCNGVSFFGGCDARAASAPTVSVGLCPGDGGL